MGGVSETGGKEVCVSVTQWDRDIVAGWLPKWFPSWEMFGGCARVGAVAGWWNLVARNHWIGMPKAFIVKGFTGRDAKQLNTVARAGAQTQGGEGVELGRWSWVLRYNLTPTKFSHCTMTMNYLAIDTETGGLLASENALLSVAFVPSWDAPPLSLKIKKEEGLAVDAEAAAVNGYTEEGWADALPAKMAAFEMQFWLHRHAPDRRFECVAHNAGFDALFIMAFQHRTGIDLQLPGIWHCSKTLLETMRRNGTLPAGKNRLDDLGEISGFWKKEPRAAKHDALQDARAALHGFLWLEEKRKGAAQP